MSLTIGSDGSVTSSKASGLPAQDANACLADAAKKLQFPKPSRGEVSVSVQIKFRPGIWPEASWGTTAGH